MQLAQHARHLRTKTGVALWLTFAAGCIDIVGFLTIYRTFTANMTGATVRLGQNLIAGRWPDAAKVGCILAAFLLGSIIGRTIIEAGARWRVRNVASATLLLEAALVVAVVPLSNAPARALRVVGLLAMLAGAMGLQTATLTRVGSLTVHTTFVTGMLNKLAQLLSHAAFLTYDKLRGCQVIEHRRQVVRQARFMFTIWVAYLGGAVIGTWMASAWGTRSLIVPACAVAMVIIVDQMAPLSVEEERDEPER